MAEQGEQLKGDDLLRNIEQAHMKDDIPAFQVGDTVEVGYRIREGDRQRVQVFSGVCIARKGSGNRETFTVRRIVQGEGVERVFPLHSPNIRSIEVSRRGRVRRAKLHYLRGLKGRATRVQEDMRARSEEKKQKKS